MFRRIATIFEMIKVVVRNNLSALRDLSVAFPEEPFLKLKSHLRRHHIQMDFTAWDETAKKSKDSVTASN